MAETIDAIQAFIHGITFSLNADEIAPARNLGPVMGSDEFQVGTVPFKQMGRLLLVLDEYFFYLFRSTIPFVRNTVSPLLFIYFIISYQLSVSRNSPLPGSFMTIQSARTYGALITEN